jgi:chemotaxis protein MotB
VKSSREQPILIVRRRKRHEGGHHGGAWKVAFADFTTSMMALFLVLWLVTQSSDVKAAIAGYFQDPMGRANEFGNSIIPGQGAQAQNVRPLTQQQIMDASRDRLRALGERIRRRLELSEDWASVSSQVEVELTDEGLRIQLLEDSVVVFFESGSAAPSRRGRELLSLIGSELGAIPNRVVVEGHTDARPYVSTEGYSNWELSADRANTARRILEAGGLRPGRVTQVRGYADNDLKDPDRPLSPRNRRVTITMIAAGDSALAAGIPPLPAPPRPRLPR